jgi:hypothetical protein
MAIEIVDLPSYKMVDLSIAMLVYQRVTHILPRSPMNPEKLSTNQPAGLYHQAAAGRKDSGLQLSFSTRVLGPRDQTIWWLTIWFFLT